MINQIIPQSAVLIYMIAIITQLKWAWDFVLYESFFQPRGIMLQEYADRDLGIIIPYKMGTDSQELAECAVCLCRIDEGDDVRELRCDHLFHQVCLDRWVVHGHVTCPLCRNILKPPMFAAELHQEVIVFNFWDARSRHDDSSTWWLR